MRNLATLFFALLSVQNLCAGFRPPTGRLTKKSDLTTVLEKTPVWFREIYYDLSSTLQRVFLFSDVESRKGVEKIASSVEGAQRDQVVREQLNYIQNVWSEEGFSIDEIYSRSFHNHSESNSDWYPEIQPREHAQVESTTARNSLLIERQESTEITADTDRMFEDSTSLTLWQSLAEYKQKRSLNTSLWMTLTSSDDEEFQWRPVNRNGSALVDSISLLLPLFTNRSRKYSDLVMMQLQPANMSSHQLVNLPDESYRLFRDDQITAIDTENASTPGFIAQHYSKDVSVTGQLYVNFLNKNFSNDEFIEMLDSFIDHSLSQSQKELLARLLADRWLRNELWQPFHHITVTSKQCQLSGKLPTDLLLILSPDAVAEIVSHCQSVWPTMAGASGPLLGRLSRAWLTKLTAAEAAAVSQWSAATITVRTALLSGALPEELALIPGLHLIDSASRISLAHLNRAQAQPLLNALLSPSSLPILSGLLKHLQPVHVRRLYDRLSELIEALPWILAENDASRKESASFGTHVQIRMLVGTLMDELTASAIYNVGKLFYTQSFHEIYHIYARNITITSEILRVVSSPHVEQMAARTLLHLYLLRNDCNACNLIEVPNDLIGEVSDNLLQSFKLKGGLSPLVIKKFLSTANRMLIGKQANIFDSLRNFMRDADEFLREPINFAGSSDLWDMSSPHDLELFTPALLKHMERMSRVNSREYMIQYASGLPAKIVSQILDKLLLNEQEKTWTSESMLGLRSYSKKEHGPWIYLSRIGCDHIEAINPLDIVPIAEEIERQLKFAEVGSMSLEVCACLHAKMKDYLRLKHLLLTSPRELIVRNFSTISAHNITYLQHISVSEAYAIPPCIFLLFSRSYLESHTKPVRLIIWRRIAQLQWPQLLQHLSAGTSLHNDFAWVAERLLSDIGAGHSSAALNLTHLLQLNQLVHFVNASIITKIEPDSFKSWIYTLLFPQERLVCRPLPEWSSVILQAFGRPKFWPMSTAFYLGGWIFALKPEERQQIKLEHLRLALDDHLQSLFTDVTDTISDKSNGRRSMSFVAACLRYGDSSIDLRQVFDMARLSGVVGSPRFIEAQQQEKDEVDGSVLSSEDVALLSRSLQSALDNSDVGNDTRHQVRLRMATVLRKMSNSFSQQRRQSKLSSYEYWSDDTLRCEDLRSAEGAVVAITAEELKQMAQMSAQELWSCLNHLGQQDWSVSNTTTLADVWEMARPMNTGPLSPDHMVNLRDIVSVWSPEEISRISVRSTRFSASLDALSVLAEQKWTSAQLNSILTNVLGITRSQSTSLIHLYAQYDHVVAMGRLICGLTAEQVGQLFNETIRPHLYRDTSAIIGKLVNCDGDSAAYSALAQLALGEFGDTAAWSRLHVQTVGAVVAGLSGDQWARLPEKALSGLQPLAARALVAVNSTAVGSLSDQQLGHLTPTTAHELLALAVFTDQQRTVLSTVIRGERNEQAVSAYTVTKLSPTNISSNGTVSSNISAFNHTKTVEKEINSTLAEVEYSRSSDHVKSAKIKQDEKGIGVSVNSTDTLLLFSFMFLLWVKFVLFS